jgi:hypothetical protein
MRNGIIFGCSMQNDTLPEWERVIHAAAHLQQILPEAVLVGGTASALYADHRLSTDADHVLTDLRKRFDDILTQLESVSGWQTARITRPVQILGSLDGIETGVRQLIRREPLETMRMDCHGVQVTVPTTSEMLRRSADAPRRRSFPYPQSGMTDRCPLNRSAAIEAAEL